MSRLDNPRFVLAWRKAMREGWAAVRHLTPEERDRYRLLRRTKKVGIPEALRMIGRADLI